MSDQPHQLQYAHGQPVRRPASVHSANVVLVFGMVPSIVGLLILLLYSLTAFELLTQLGLLWLPIGGLMAFVTGLTSLVMLPLTWNAPNSRAVRSKYAVALIAAILSLPTAWFCTVTGENLLEGPHFRLGIDNATTVNLDRVTVHFDEGDITLGPIAPGKSVRSGLKWIGHNGPLDITVEANGGTRRKTERDSVSRWDLKGDFDLRVESSELPR